jgi:hypothetical protein
MIRIWVAFPVAFLAIAVHAQFPSGSNLGSQPTSGRQVAQVSKLSSVTKESVISITGFSATMSGGLAQEDPKKIYRSGNLVRVAFEKKYHVTDLNNRVTWVVHPDRCTRFPGPDVDTLPFLPLSLAEYKVERTETGQTETIDGHLCKIQTATFTPRDGRPPINARTWVAQDLSGFPIKLELDPGRGHVSTFIYQHVSVEPPDPALFKLPQNCTDFRTGKQVNRKGKRGR